MTTQLKFISDKHIQSGRGAAPTDAQPQPTPTAEPKLRVSAIIPCLDEEETLGICIEKALTAFSALGIDGEVVVGDNGSTDDSVRIAEELGARVAHQPVRGYGAALKAAIVAAEGEYLIMADADDSYDWSDLKPFIDALANVIAERLGHVRVVGGQIERRNLSFAEHVGECRGDDRSQ